MAQSWLAAARNWELGQVSLLGQRARNVSPVFSDLKA